jgi:hypothetical protein
MIAQRENETRPQMRAAQDERQMLRQASRTQERGQTTRCMKPSHQEEASRPAF